MHPEDDSDAPERLDSEKLQPIAQGSEQLVEESQNCALVLSTRLQEWAVQRPDVERVVLGHTGEQHTVTLLLHPYSLEGLVTAHHELSRVLMMLGERPSEIYIYGPEYRDWRSFWRFGTDLVYSKGDRGPIDIPPSPSRSDPRSSS